MTLHNSPVLIVVALAGLLGLAGCQRPGPQAQDLPPEVRESISRTGLTLDDAILSAQVKAALLASRELNGTDISVTSSRGRVTLRGNVPLVQISRAEKVARSVRGVRRVDNRLKPAGVLV